MIQLAKVLIKDLFDKVVVSDRKRMNCSDSTAYKATFWALLFYGGEAC